MLPRGAWVVHQRPWLGESAHRQESFLGGGEAVMHEACHGGQGQVQGHLNPVAAALPQFVVVLRQPEFEGFDSGQRVLGIAAGYGLRLKA